MSKLRFSATNEPDVPPEGKSYIYVDQTDGHLKQKNSDGTIYDLTAGGITTFIALTDTPNSYTGQAGKFVRVNATEDGLEFGDVVTTDEKVKVSNNDTTEDYLENKIVAGNGINITTVNEGGNEQLRISATISTDPSGSDQEVQFNKAGSFGSDPHFKYDYNNYTLILNSSDYGPWIQSYNTASDYNHEFWLVDELTYIIDDGSGNKTVLRVGTNDIDFYDNKIVFTTTPSIDIAETSTAPTAETGKGKLYVDASDKHIKFVASDGTTYDLTQGGGGGGATTFLELTDTPNSYSGNEEFYLRVRPDGTGIEFVPLIATGPDGAVQYNYDGRIEGSDKLVFDFENSILDVKGDVIARRVYLYDNQDTSTTPKAFMGERTHSGFRRILFYGEPDDGNTFGFITSPDRSDKTYYSFFGFWNADADQGAPPGFAYAGVLLEPDGKLRFFSSNNDVYFRPALASSSVYYHKEGNITLVGINTDKPYDALQVGEAGDGTRAVANEWATFSDARVKEVVSEFDKGLEIIEKLQPKIFKYKNSTDKKDHYGLIAQDVKEAGLKEAVKLSGGLYTLDYNTIILTLINAVKELSSRVKELEEKVSSNGTM